MELAEKLDQDFKDALKNKDAARLSIMRLVRSGIKNFEIAKQGKASSEDIIAILQREIKQHKETIAALQKAGRAEDLKKQEEEVAVLKSYLPAQLSQDELKDFVEEAIASTAAAGLSDLGKVMGKVMPQVKGRATGDEVGQMAREILSKNSS